MNSAAATAEINRISSSNPDAKPAVVPDLPKTPTLETAHAKRDEAVAELGKVLNAIARTSKVERDATVGATECERRIQDIATRAALADESEQEGTSKEHAACLLELQSFQDSANAARSGLQGLKARQQAAEATLASAQRTYAQSIVDASRPVVAALQKQTKELFHAAFKSQADLLNLGASLASLDENVSTPLDANSYSTTDLQSLIEESATAAGLRRERRDCESFVRIGYGATFNAAEIVAMLEPQ